MKSALFVDFDNVFSALRMLDPAVAERFAMRPIDWIRWLIESLPLPPHAPAQSARRVLVRRCYLNPQVYQRSRPAFNRAGFEIIDCPPMTSQGKTSTDIHMVLDIVDLLQHQVHYDEFIVFSADADFTPVLRKLRRWDRRTTVLAIGFPSAAYQASADLLIDPDDFIRHGLGFEPAEAEAEPDPAAAPNAPPVRDKSDIAREVGLGLDPGRQAVADKASPGAASDPSATESGTADPATIAALVREAVTTAGRAVPGGRLAQLIIDRYPAFAADWGGNRNFRRMLDGLDLAPLKADWTVAGGQVSDPSIQDTEREGRVPPAQRRDWGADSPLLPVMYQVHAATGAPLLSPADLRTIIDSLRDDLAQHGFQLSETSKRVRDRCRGGGHTVSREDVSFVLKGILLAGHAFGDAAPSSRAELIERFRDSLLQLCHREQLALDAGQISQLMAWAARAAE